MATLKEFKKKFIKVEEHPNFSNISVRSHVDCPYCKTNMLILWSFYPETFIKYPQGNGGFSVNAVEWHRTPDGEIIRDYEYKSGDPTDKHGLGEEG